MKILIIASYYIPDGGPAGQLYKLLCEALSQRGHQVTVLTSVPHYPSGRVPKEFRGKWIFRTTENGVNVVRVSLPSVNRSNLLARMVQFISFQLNAIIACFWEKYDVVLTHSPAIESLFPYIYYSILRRKPAIYSVHDVYPDVGIKLGIFRNKLVINAVATMEQVCLNNSAKVRILSSSFLAGLQKLNVNQDKIALIYDWVDTDAIRPLPKINMFSQEFGLTNSFIVAYAGNLGLVQGLDTILDAAKILLSNKEITFVFVGDGSNRIQLFEKAKRLELSNVLFIPYQPIERMSEVLSSVDVVLVSLSKGTGFGALPSKTYSIMASGRPIIACLDPGSEAWDLVERSKAGICIEPENPEQLANAIMKLKSDVQLRNEYGENGRKYVEMNHSPEKAAEQFEALFLDCIKAG